MNLKSTLQVLNEADLKSEPGIVEGQTIKRLIGHDERPTDRICATLASFKPGTLEHLHWHLIEAFNYVISGRAVIRDIEGRSHDIGPGSMIYAPPGIAGSHQWDIKEQLQLISPKATRDPEKSIQFDVDISSKRSSVAFDYLIKRGGAEFRSLY